MTTLRIVGYIFGIVWALALFGKNLRIKLPLARCFVAAMAGWAINAAMLLTLLVATELGLDTSWRSLALSFDALIIGIVPLAMFWYWGKNGNSHG